MGMCARKIWRQSLHTAPEGCAVACRVLLASLLLTYFVSPYFVWLTAFVGPPVLARLDALINQRTVSGHRYAEQARREVDTEDFAATPG